MLRVFNICVLSIAVTFSQLVVADDAIEVPQKYERAFPIWAQEAIDLGHELPKPYGFSINYMTMEQPLVVDSVAFTGLGDFIDDRISINGSEALQDSETLTFRADMWVLPFLNLYGVIGHTKGSSVANVQVDVDLPFFPELDPFDFELNFKGTTYGVGGTIVGGIDNWFALLDVNYTNTDLDILDGEISTIVVSPRVGYRTKVYGQDLQVWVGAMYQNVEQTFSGYLKDILPIGGTEIGEFIGDGKFEVNQHLEDKWNTLVGAQISLGNGFDLLLEGGFGTRTSFMAGIGYRF